MLKLCDYLGETIKNGYLKKANICGIIKKKHHDWKYVTELKTSTDRLSHVSAMSQSWDVTEPPLGT